MRPISKSLRPKFSPARLFAAGALGAWYDPSSLWGAGDHLPRRNLLTSTATLATQTKTVTAASHTLYIKGTGSVTLSGAATGTLNGTGASDRVSLVFTPTAGSLTLTVSGTVTEGHLTTTATLDHSYQAIVGSDFTTEQYAHAASKNVPWLRRNALLNTEDFTQASWTKSTLVTAPSANIVQETTNTSHHVIGSGSFTAGTYVVLARIKKVNVRFITFGLYNNAGTFEAGACIDLDTAVITTGSVGSGYSATAATITDAGSGYYDVAVRCTIAFTSVCFIGLRSTSYSSGRLTESYAGNVANQLEATRVLCMPYSGVTPTYQAVGASWEATFAANAAAAGVVPTMYQDSAGTTPVTGPDSVIGKLNDLSGGGYHAIQSGATGLKPTLRLSPNGYWYIQRDLSDDALVTTFPNLGTACASYINDGSTVTETTGLTLNGALTQSTPAADYGRVYLNAPSPKAAQLVKWLKAKAGIT